MRFVRLWMYFILSVFLILCLVVFSSLFIFFFGFFFSNWFYCFHLLSFNCLSKGVSIHVCVIYEKAQWKKINIVQYDYSHPFDAQIHMPKHFDARPSNFIFRHLWTTEISIWIMFHCISFGCCCCLLLLLLLLCVC